MKKEWASLLIVCMVLIYSCQQEEPIIEHDNYSLQLPLHFPKPIFPDDNQLTKSRVLLGKMLFYEKLFAADSSISCASCHKQEKAFADIVKTSPGSENAPGTRNSPSLANVLFQPYMLREGGVPTIEMQVLVPIQEHNEFNNNILLIVDKLKDKEPYKSLSIKAYNRPMDSYVLTRALASFERTLISSQSAYDNYLKGDKAALSIDAIKGMNLFFDSLNCGKCHSGALLTNFGFENNGLYQNYIDVGRARFTKDKNDEGKFKIPSLRNVALTPPYMFDGSLATLQDVLDHYSAGGKNHPNKNDFIKPFSLSDEQKKQIITFLESLTDYVFVNDLKFKPE